MHCGYPHLLTDCVIVIPVSITYFSSPKQARQPDGGGRTPSRMPSIMHCIRFFSATLHSRFESGRGHSCTQETLQTSANLAE